MYIKEFLHVLLSRDEADAGSLQVTEEQDCCKAETVDFRLTEHKADALQGLMWEGFSAALLGTSGLRS